MSARRLSLLAQQVFWVALLVVPVVFSTRSFEAFLTVKQFLAASFLWLAACLYLGACARGGASLPRSILAYALLALILELLLSTIHADRLPAAVFSFFTIVPFGVGLVFCTAAASSPTFRNVSRTVILSASAVGAITPAVRAALARADCVFFDGTFWSSDELPAQGLGASRAEDMAHVPVGGSRGSLAVLGAMPGARRIFIHINNTNPLLREDSPERQAIVTGGWEVAFDGMEVVL